MSNYRQNGPMAVSGNVDRSANVAGFGARRFMQDMYQQQQQQQPDSQGSGLYYTSKQPVDKTYHQTYAVPYPHSDAYPASQSTGRTYHQSPSPRQAALPLPAMPSQDQKRSASRSPLQSHGKPDQRDNQAGIHSSRSRSTTDVVSSSSHRDANARTVWRSDSLESSASDSTAGLAYDRSGDTQYSRKEHFSPIEHSTPSRRAQIPTIKVAERATIYEDDYEEDDYREPLADFTSSTPGDTSTDTPFRVVRATVLEPDLPKAKCADCGEKLDFEELSNHSCQPANSSRTPLLSIKVPASTSGSTLSSAATSPGLSTPRSPFFDRYDDLIPGSAPVSSAPFETTMRLHDAGLNGDDGETPKAHAVRIIGTQAAIKVPHVKAHSHSGPVDSRLQPVCPLPLVAPSIQRSASDTQAEAAARRKMIEEQRAAKRKDMMASPLPRAATTSNISKKSVAPEDLSRSKSAKSPAGSFSTTPHIDALNVTEAQHVKTASLSSVETGTSERAGLSPQLSAVTTANMTPSSSYERIEDDAPQQSLKGSKDTVSSRQTRERSRVDLSGIEEMMKDLAESPEPLQRTLLDIPRKSAPRDESTMEGSLRPRSVSVTVPSQTDRERALELELARLRDKERFRQLQALRLKEKKKRERAARRCCVCDCSLSSSRTPFVERDGKLLCARDWKELYLPKCRKCNLIVEKGAVKSSDGALRGVFHRSCFSCAACEAPFTDGSFYVFNNQPYCSRHYHRLNRSLCRECESGIEGDCRQTDMGDRFHPNCFSCQYSSKKGGGCNEPLADYYMVGGQRLCERHADKVGRRLAKAGQKQLDLRAQKRMTMLHSLR